VFGALGVLGELVLLLVVVELKWQLEQLQLILLTEDLPVEPPPLKINLVVPVLAQSIVFGVHGLLMEIVL